MPIHKERLLDLVNAGEHLESLVHINAQEVLRSIAAVRAGTITAQQALDDLETHFTGYELQLVMQSRVLLSERIRWNLTHARNDYDKERRSRQRLAQGIQPRQIGRRVQPRPTDIRNLSTRDYLAQMEALGLSVEEALEYAEAHQAGRSLEEVRTMKPLATPNEPSAAPNDTPTDDPFFEDSDDFDIPTAETIEPTTETTE